MLPHTGFIVNLLVRLTHSCGKIPWHTCTEDQCTDMNPTAVGADLMDNVGSNIKPKLLSTHPQQTLAFVKWSIEKLILANSKQNGEDEDYSLFCCKLLGCVLLLDIHRFSDSCSLYLIKITGMLEPVQTVTGRRAKQHPGLTTSLSQDTDHSFTNSHPVPSLRATWRACFCSVGGVPHRRSMQTPNKKTRCISSKALIVNSKSGNVKCTAKQPKK